VATLLHQAMVKAGTDYLVSQGMDRARAEATAERFLPSGEESVAVNERLAVERCRMLADMEAHRPDPLQWKKVSAAFAPERTTAAVDYAPLVDPLQLASERAKGG